jgi:hypothetical protein
MGREADLAVSREGVGTLQIKQNRKYIDRLVCHNQYQPSKGTQIANLCGGKSGEAARRWPWIERDSVGQGEGAEQDMACNMFSEGKAQFARIFDKEPQ